MPRYIDADELKNQYREILKPQHQIDLIRVMDDFVNSQPTIDAGTKWISVKERLPEEDGEYLVVLCEHTPLLSMFVDLRWFATDMKDACFSVAREFEHQSGWYFCERDYGDVEDTSVLYWMQKPVPPEETKGEEK